MRWLIVGAALSLWACGSGDSGDDPSAHKPAGGATAGGGPAPAGGARPSTPSVDPFFTVGTGARGYEPLIEGQEVPIIQGIQGGFHVWGGFHAAGFSDKNVQVSFNLTHAGAVVAEAEYVEPSLPRNAAGEYEYAQVAVVFLDNDDSRDLSGESVILTGRVTTEQGEIHEGSVTIVPVCCQ